MPKNWRNIYLVFLFLVTILCVSEADAQVTIQFSPTGGNSSGGTIVIITNSGQSSWGTVSDVKFGSVSASNFSVNASNNQITAEAPPQTIPSGQPDLRVKISVIGNQTYTTNADFVYNANAPIVTGFTPTSGGQGTVVTITGSNFTRAGGSTVYFDGIGVGGVANNDNQITLNLPGVIQTSGIYTVNVTNGAGTGTAPQLFNFIARPSLSTITPNSGTASGGQTVVITGSNLTSASSVKFGSVSAQSYTVDNSGQITAITPAGSIGLVDIEVTTPGGSSTLSSAYRYLAPPSPTITSLTPTSGSTSGGTSVTITGTDLTGATAVTFGATAATSFTVNSATQITAVAPAGSAGAVNVSVTTGGGTATQNNAFTYISAPTASSFTPSSAIVGATVTLTGTNFTGATAVSFGNTAATSFTVVNSTTITAVVPQGTGSVNVSVTTPGGTVTFPSQFTYTNETQLKLTVSNTNPLVGVPVTLSATITPTSATGTISFKSGSQLLGAIPLKGGAASLVTTFGLGTFAITAEYSGDANYSSSKSNSISITPSRPNPANDPKVRGIVLSQVNTLQQTTQTNIDNIQRRLEKLHGDVDSVENGIAIRGGQTPQIANCQSIDLRDRDTNKCAAQQNEGRMNRELFQNRTTSSRPENVNPAPINNLIKPDLAIWSAGTIMVGKQDYTGSTQKTRSSLQQITAGLDGIIMPNLKGGVAITLSANQNKIDDIGTKNDAMSTLGTIYGSYNLSKGFFLDALLGGGMTDFNTQRFDTNASTMLTGNRPAQMAFASLALSWEQRAGALKYAPYVRMDAMRAVLNRYNETGHYDWNLAFASTTINSQTAILGLRAQYDFKTDWGALSPTARAEYRYLFGSSTNQAIMYVADPSTIYGLTVAGTNRSAFMGALGIQASGSSITGQLEYLLMTGGDAFFGQGLRGTFSLKF